MSNSSLAVHCTATGLHVTNAYCHHICTCGAAWKAWQCQECSSTSYPQPRHAEHSHDLPSQQGLHRASVLGQAPITAVVAALPEP